ncbi:MAG: geranylgeranylglyceryl/heptaprenylglyceryl phosphate synthase [bacterium]|jgi:putative glycerol-1-phosphate prenyltransferase
MAGVYEHMLSFKTSDRAGYVVLIDPDRIPMDDIEERVALISRYADLVFIGGSIVTRGSFDEAIRRVKRASEVPVVIFPGDATQVSGGADAIMFLSLVSGRNADLLIGEHVKAAPLVRNLGLEAIPVAYILVESGRTTSVQFMSQTLAIPGDKPEIAMAHALAGEYLGMKAVFLEAGSGAENHVPAGMVKAVSDYVSVPVMVGGGIRTPDMAGELVKSGATFIVTGDIIEKHASESMLEDFSRAVRETCRERG